VDQVYSGEQRLRTTFGSVKTGSVGWMELRDELSQIDSRKADRLEVQTT
jgi:hypothetical protein